MGVWIETDHNMYWNNGNGVTPYVGVWIETKGITVLNGIAKSLLMWECGLKHVTKRSVKLLDEVTPYVGVWIETRITPDR